MKKIKEFFSQVENIVGFIFVSIIASLFGFIIWIAINGNVTYPVHGKVIDKFRTDAGYKSTPEAHVVIYSDSLKRNVDIKVTWNTYANAVIGRTLYFKLSEYDLNR